MIKNNLRHILVDKNMSIRELSERIGVTYSMVYEFAHMRRSSVQFKVLDAICTELDVAPGDILLYEPGDE
jgi:putative transcriptional regulator